MIPCSSPRSSGWRATDWIIDPKMFPIPTPAPSAPRPMPMASAIALPASATFPLVAARRVPTNVSSLVSWLDRRADVDGGKGGEDERLDADDDHDLEEVEGRRERNGDDREGDVLEHEDQPDE